MAIRFPDSDIGKFITEPKLLPANFCQLIQLRMKRGHREAELAVKGEHESDFRIIFRQSHFNALDFSVILALVPSRTNLLFRLRRYNGKHSAHTNKIEGDTFTGFHIHMATERYQDLGMREDSYAEQTERFSDIEGAKRCMFKDCNFIVPSNEQFALFEED